MTQEIEQPVIVAPARYVLLPVANSITGYSVKAMERKIERGDWPEGKLEVLQIGRLLWKANYVARFVQDSLDALSMQYGDVFRNFEHTGELRLPDPPPPASA